MSRVQTDNPLNFQVYSLEPLPKEIRTTFELAGDPYDENSWLTWNEEVFIMNMNEGSVPKA